MARPTKIESRSLGRAKRTRSGSGHLRCGARLAVVMIMSPGSLTLSSPARSYEARGLFQRYRLVPEWRKSRLGILHQRLEAGACRVSPEQRDQRRLAAAGIFGHGLAHRCGIALGVEKVVGKLEGLTEG